MTKTNIKTAFRIAGIVPLDRSIVLNRETVSHAPEQKGKAQSGRSMISINNRLLTTLEMREELVKRDAKIAEKEKAKQAKQAKQANQAKNAQSIDATKKKKKKGQQFQSPASTTSTTPAAPSTNSIDSDNKTRQIDDLTHNNAPAQPRAGKKRPQIKSIFDTDDEIDANTQQADVENIRRSKRKKPAKVNLDDFLDDDVDISAYFDAQTARPSQASTPLMATQIVPMITPITTMITTITPTGASAQTPRGNQTRDLQAAPLQASPNSTPGMFPAMQLAPSFSNNNYSLNAVVA